MLAVTHCDDTIHALVVIINYHYYTLSFVETMFLLLLVTAV